MFTISKQTVWNAYKRVKANKGAAGVDKETLSEFEKDLKNNLYKIWNRMSSGSYHPSPIREVEIPKRDGKKRRLGIATVTDRIAQQVVRSYMEPDLERLFHEDSYGYRPNKSAHGALSKARERCWRYDWVLDMDIKGFFDEIDWELLMRAVRKHTQSKWILLYIERWLKAPIQRADGRVEERTKGTPQGGVISPLLANLYLHYGFDEWMRRNHPDIEFERYADDIIVHCKTQSRVMALKTAIEQRLKDCKLALHPDKTHIVYCKDANRKQKYPKTSFDFLGFTFRPRMARSRKGEMFLSFLPAISQQSKKAIREKLRLWRLHMRCKTMTLAEIAERINPIISGWITYYGKFYGSAMEPILDAINLRLIKWARKKFKKFKGSFRKASKWLQKIAEMRPGLFAHWRKGYDNI